MEIIAHFKKLDWILVVVAVLLVCFGLLSLYSSSLSKNDFDNFQKQIVFLMIGIFLMFLLSFFDWRILRTDSYLILILYFLSILALIGLFFFAPEIRGVKGWYKIGSYSVDPIEFTKVVLVILLAKYFSMRHIEMYRMVNIVLSGVYLLIPSILIFLQPNLGSVLILISLWVGILIISGIRLKHFLLLFLCGTLLLAIGWGTLLKDYQKERIISFIVPQSDPLGISWNQNQSKIAIGSGGLFGQGFGKGSQTQYGFLPEVKTDFIFASIAEEFGLIGVLILFILFIVLIQRVMSIAFYSQNNFPRLFATGFCILLMVQIFIHIGMNIGILPIIGISLPLVSYGGSNLIAFFICLGIIQSIKAH